MIMITSPCHCWTSASVLRCFGTGWLTQPRFVLCFSSCFALSRSQSFGCFACCWRCSSCLPFAMLLSCLPLAMLFCLLLALLFCLLLALLFSVLFIFSPLLDDERCSAIASSLRCSSRCPRTRVALLRSSRHKLFGCGSVSDPLQRHFVAVYSFLDASLAPPAPPLSTAPLLIVGSAPRLCSLQRRGLLTVRTAAAVRRWFPVPLQYYCVVLWAVSILMTKAYIAASCHGVVRRFVRHRCRVLEPHVSVVWFLSRRLVSFTVTVTVTRHFPSRVLLTFSVALHAGATHAFELC